MNDDDELFGPELKWANIEAEWFIERVLKWIIGWISAVIGVVLGLALVGAALWLILSSPVAVTMISVFAACVAVCWLITKF